MKIKTRINSQGTHHQKSKKKKKRIAFQFKKKGEGEKDVRIIEQQRHTITHLQRERNKKEA